MSVLIIVEICYTQKRIFALYLISVWSELCVISIWQGLMNRVFIGACLEEIAIPTDVTGFSFLLWWYGKRTQSVGNRENNPTADIHLFVRNIKGTNDVTDIRNWKRFWSWFECRQIMGQKPVSLPSILLLPAQWDCKNKHLESVDNFLCFLCCNNCMIVFA